MQNTPVHIWKQAPFLRLLPAFIVGILLYWWAGAGIRSASIIASCAMALMLCYLRLPDRKKYFFSWWMGISVYALLVATGIIIGFYRDGLNRTAQYSRLIAPADMLVVQVTETPAERPQSYKAVVQVEKIIRNHRSMDVHGELLLYLRKDSNAALVRYGSRILLQANLQLIPGNANPGGFNYRDYCRFRGIKHQCFASGKQWKLVPGGRPPALGRFLLWIQTKIREILNRYIHGDTEKGMAEALLLGYKDDLDRDLLQLYANTGIVHIIAISGMHLGLVYWILSQMVRPLQRFKKIGWLAPVFILAGLWLFALLTGAGPSILRSAIMFSCIVLGKRLSRRASIYNSLAAAAFLLLCWQPFWLWDAGFQLSFTAVLSIVVFAKPVYNGWCINNRMLDYAWKMVSVTLAAQILTTPVSIYHFHQFPVYFLPANLVAIPLSTIIIFLEISLCLFAPIPVLAAPAGAITQWLISLMNRYAALIEQLPYAVWNGMQVSFFQLLLIYLLIAGCSTWWLAKNRLAIWPTLLSLLGILALRDMPFINAGQQQMLIVYSLPGNTLVDFVSARQCLAVGDGLPRQVAQSRALFRVGMTDSIPGLAHAGPLFTFRGKLVVLLDSLTGLPAMPFRDPAALVVLTNNPDCSLTELERVFRCRHFVADASNQRFRVKKWEREAAAAGLDCYYVGDKGAFVMNFN